MKFEKKKKSNLRRKEKSCAKLLRGLVYTLISAFAFGAICLLNRLNENELMPVTFISYLAVLLTLSFILVAKLSHRSVGFFVKIFLNAGLWLAGSWVLIKPDDFEVGRVLLAFLLIYGGCLFPEVLSSLSAEDTNSRINALENENRQMQDALKKQKRLGRIQRRNRRRF